MTRLTDPERTARHQATARSPRSPRTRQRSQPASFYRTVWRWHFYAGVIVAPVLVVVAATGALYIFKAELERFLYPDLMFATPAETRATYNDQLDAVAAAAGEGFKPTQFIVEPDPHRATLVYASDGKQYRAIYVDPYRGQVLGALGEHNFFSVVLKLHRQLFVGTTGRIVVELTTCWTIVLVVTGLYLWWPRKRTQIRGVWLPRLRGGMYRTLRDLHAVSGAYVALIALTIAATGLLYTFVWGSGYGYAALRSGAYAMFTDPPRSKSAAEAPPLALDEIVRIAREKHPGTALTLLLPNASGQALRVFASREIGPTSDAVLVLDHATGEILRHVPNREYPALGWWATWNYPLHVGSVLGLPTKILWLIAALGLMLMPITGVWMWWQRRPRGTAGLPRKVDIAVPRGIVAVICALGLVLPALGVSLVLILLGEAALRRVRRRTATC